MTWTAQIQSIGDAAALDGSKYVTVIFTFNPIASPDVQPKQFTQSLKLAPGNWVSASAVRNFISDKLHDLNANEDVAADVAQTLIGTLIDPTSGGIASSRTICTNAQLRIALLNAGLYTTVDNAVATMSNRNKISWAYSPYFTIDSPFLSAVASLLGYTPTQLNNFFDAAYQIKV